ncbi:GTPase [Roseomonas sp. OT10]|uniref:flagellar biosynthesis protein FlhF n=1 Tax=Roseomonas cutis TaxID=2897332 RepID=UPI001E46FAE1|nr:GTPase [Roseomonas sp. OT10]UFN48284.1 GTPase [Roseomonas sp. OT10]
MRLRVFHAPSMAQAMAQLRAELGADVVILDNRRVAGGVEVTAALEAEELPPAAPGAPDPGAPQLLRPRLSLARHNLPPALAARLQGPLAPALAACFTFAPLPDGGGPVLALMGPPGAGKTLTCAKLATRDVLSGGVPLVVTADSTRAGAVEQLAAFTRLLGVTLEAVASPGQAARSLAGRRPGQLALLDTAGCDPFDTAQAAGLLALLQETGAEPVLVLPAGLDVQEAAELARAFAALGARRMVPTRLDVARRLGSVLAAAEAGALLLAEAGTGPGVTEGLTPLTPDWLAERLCPGTSADTRHDAAA